MLDHPIIYVSGPEYDPDKFRPELLSVHTNADRIVQALHISSIAGDCFVKTSVRHDTPEIVNASAAKLSPTAYEISLETGLIFRAWLYSRVLERFSADLLPWTDSARVVDPRAPAGITTPIVLAEYAFYLTCQFVFYHELAHIVLGHLDYLFHRSSLSVLRESGDGTHLELSDLRAVEADADRQGLLWCATQYDDTLGQHGLGLGLRFPTQEAAWDFFGFVLTLTCVLFQNESDQSIRRSHPDANERSFILLAFIDDYLQRSGRTEQARSNFMKQAGRSRIIYAKQLGLRGGWSVEGNARACDFVSGVGATLNKMGIRRFQMKCAPRKARQQR